VSRQAQIVNTDQGSRFTGSAFTGVLIKNAIAISMDGKGAWRDNVFVEWLWRSVKMRGCLSESLRQRQRGLRLDRPLPGLLQRPQTTLEP
jgi:transposase InsO family protein